MFKKSLTALLFLGSLSGFYVAADAAEVPSVHAVYQAANAGRLDAAHSMIEQVIQAHPDSAKAHFVDAEILARQGAMRQAEGELAQAEKLAPGLGFAYPEAVQALRARLAAAHAQPAPQTANDAGLMGSVTPDAARPFPWSQLLLAIGAVAGVFLLIRAIRPKAVAPANGMLAPGTGWSPAATPGMPGYGGAAPMTPTAMTPASGGLGASLASGLATGAAVGVGVVAGEALMHHFMDGGQSGNAAVPVAPPAPPVPAQPAYDMGGADFGLNDSGAWDDTQTSANTDSSDDWG